MTETWNQTYGGAEMDEAWSLVRCQSGGYALAGTTNSSGAGDVDAWLVLTDTAGNHLWNQTYGGSAQDEVYSIVECTGGGFALLGTSYTYDNPPNFSDLWLIRTDDSGNMVWNKTYGTGNGDYGSSLVECGTTGFALAGYTLSYGNGGDLWLIRTDAAGNPLWNRTYGGSLVEKGYYGHILTRCSDGGFALTGYTTSFNPTPGGGDFYLVRTNSSGHMQWNSTFGDVEIDRCWSVIETQDGGLIITGTSQSQISGPGGLWVVKTDASGNYLWDTNYGLATGEGCYHIIEMANQDLLFAGYTTSYGAGQSDFWLLRTTASGTPLWNETYGDGSNQKAHAVVVLGPDDFALAGYSQNWGTLDFDFFLVRVHIEPPPTTPTTPTTTPPIPAIPGFPMVSVLLGLVVALLIPGFHHRRKHNTPNSS
jgi:hypothetical protein